MNAALLAQSDRLTPLLDAVRDRFQRGGSIASVVFAVVGLVAVLGAIYLFMCRRDKFGARGRLDDPQRLFRDLLHKLELPLEQRRLLEAVVRDLRVAHPTALLLSANLFDRYVDRWRSEGRRRPADEGPELQQLVDSARRSLFRAA